MKYLLILLSVFMIVAGLLSCGKAVTTTTLTTGIPQYRPIEVVGVVGPVPPFNPGGPVVEITLKNNGGEPVISLMAALLLEKTYEFDFNVTKQAPLVAGQSISLQKTLIGPGSTIDSEATYHLQISATLQSGSFIGYTVDIKIGTPPPAK